MTPFTPLFPTSASGHRRRTPIHTLVARAVSTLCLLWAPHVSADQVSPERRFAYTHPSLTEPVGELELETWGTWKNRSGTLRTFAFSHEFEIGLTRHTQLGLSIANWSVDARSGKSRFEDASIEVIHNLTSPITDTFGSAVSAEVAMGERSTTLEAKLILEKRFGKWVLGWNGALEAAWEGERFGDLQASTGELTQSIGLGYDICPCLTIGLEALHTLPLDRWHGPSNAELYAGPSVTFRQKHFRVTLGALFQTTNRTEEPSAQLRTIVGIEF